MYVSESVLGDQKKVQMASDGMMANRRTAKAWVNARIKGAGRHNRGRRGEETRGLNQRIFYAKSYTIARNRTEC